MLGGVNTRWKQVVAYYFTGNSVNGQIFADIIKEIFENSKRIGVNILSSLQIWVGATKLYGDVGVSMQAGIQ
jgi:hypothetical protein